jgi:hypothetical protein
VAVSYDIPFCRPSNVNLKHFQRFLNHQCRANRARRATLAKSRAV